MSLFAYGTLMFAEVWRRIGIGEFETQPATLPGYAVYRVQDSVIPGMVQTNADDQVTGLIYHGLDEETLFELDTYESDLYKRIAVQATAADGALIECQAFVIPESHRQAVTDEFWDADWFEKHELENYLNG